MTRRTRAAAVAVGLAAAAWPPLGYETGNLDAHALFAAATASRRAATDVALVVIDEGAERHPAFASHVRAEWSVPLAALVEALLDAGASVVALDVVLPRDDRVAADWLRVLRRGAHGGRIVLGGLGGDAPAWPSSVQVAAVGGSHAVGSVSLDAGIVRSVLPEVGEVPGLAALAARRAGAEPHAPVALAARPLRIWSAADILDRSLDLVQAFAGRTVFVGAWLPHDDRHRSALRATPAVLKRIAAPGPSPAEPVPGVLLHALAAVAWLEGGTRWLSPPTVWMSAVGGALVGASARLPLVAAAALVGVGAAVLAAAHAVVVPWTQATAALLASAAAASGLRNAEAAWRFASGLPAAFRTRPDACSVCEITAAFIDIESFTQTSEAAAEPEHLAADLAMCLDSLAATVEAHGGFVDKYLGDGVLALFGLDGADARASAAAAVRSLVERCERGAGPTIAGRRVRLRAGLATGRARVGSLGSGSRVHFTAIGDCVNVAARLEQMNRTLGTRILADARTAMGAPAEAWVGHGARSLRGRGAPVRVFELRFDGAPV